MNFTPVDFPNTSNPPSAYQGTNFTNQYQAAAPYQASNIQSTYQSPSAQYQPTNVTTGQFNAAAAEQYMNPYSNLALQQQLDEMSRELARLQLQLSLLRAENAQAQDQWADAARRLQELGAAEKALYGANRAHWLQLRAAQALGEQRGADALPLSETAWAATTAILPAGHPGRVAPGLRRQALLLQSGDRAAAAALLAELAPAVAALSTDSALRRRYEQLTLPKSQAAPA